MDFKNPYLELSRDATIRTTIFASKKDVAALRSYDPKDGVFQTTLSILLVKLCHELRNSTIEPGDYSGFQHAVSNCTIALGGGAVAKPATGAVVAGTEQAVSRNDRPRTKPMARKATRPSKSDDTKGASE